jgi:oxaloacetate decarboxylase gamma subunit
MEDMVSESLKYTVLGMGIVFTFLYLLVLLLRLQKILIARFFPEEEGAAVPTPWAETAARDEKRRKKAAAVMAAIHHYRKSRG